MTDTCPRDALGFCLVALVIFCEQPCRYGDMTRRDKLAIVERARQRHLRTLGSVSAPGDDDFGPASKVPDNE